MFRNSLHIGKQIYRLLLILMFAADFWSASASNGNSTSFLPDRKSTITSVGDDQNITASYSLSIRKLNLLLQESITSGDTAGSRRIIDNIFNIINNHAVDSIVISESFYYTGVYSLFRGKNAESVKWLKLSAIIREKKNVKDLIYSKSLYNLSVAHSFLGDYQNMMEYALKAFDAEKEIYGDSDTALISSLLNLLIANLELQEYEKSISYGNMAVSIVENKEEAFSPKELANLYYNLGVCYIRLSDYAKAVIYLEKTESIYRAGFLTHDDRFINLLNSLAVAYGYLGLSEKSDQYYQRGIVTSQSYNSPLSNNIINSYAISLANSGRLEKGEDLLVEALEKTKETLGTDSRYYVEFLRNYAEYLRAYNIDINKSADLYEKCMEYVDNHKEDLYLKEPVTLGYALTLSARGDKLTALGKIQELIYSGIATTPDEINLYSNPGFELIKADQRSLSLLKAKYRILWDIYKKTEDQDILMAAANTSEFIVAVLEKVRLNISEEESRLVLGDRYRDSYLLAIRDFDICYKTTGNPDFLAKAFEYSEKSKVAGLLAATRELKATQFHIPAEIADLERDLQREISYNNARIIAENIKEKPDAELLSTLNNIILDATRKRDSLISVFEKKYPEYYILKYNSRVTNLNDVPGITGISGNYINYVVSDTLLYIFVANRRNRQILSFPIDSSFFNNIKEFRSLLGMPSRSASARTDFDRFRELGYYLYSTLIEPVRKYLVSDNLLISPDNILSYLPFETFITGPYSGNDILYRDLSYMMNHFRISYIYSVTFMAESFKKEFSLKNSLIAFAPVYTGAISVDSLIKSNQTEREVLRDLPFARQEAEYVSDLVRGKLYVGTGALESVFKNESGRYDIIHLAMHTIVNDQYPMHSRMVFYPRNDSPEDGLLNTYEIYGIPLKSKMVVLSSCNTGSGLLHSGEGVLSLARGFNYSGSQSVVMSLWEIEDKSGTEIINEFYHNIKKGRTKSGALRKARKDYLEKAGQLRSHPYFWASLVVYGNNSPLYYSNHLFTLIFAACLITIFIMVLYFRRQ